MPHSTAVRPWFRIRPRIWLVPGMFLCAFSLAGCGDDEYKGIRRSDVTIESKPALGASSAPITGAETVYGQGNVPKDTASALGAGGPVGEPNAEQERIGRGDAYYKLAWVKQMLDSGSVPNDLPKALDEIRKITSKLSPDDTVLKIQEIIDKLQTGLDAHQAEQQFRSGGVDPDGVPWGIGSTELERRLKRKQGGGIRLSDKHAFRSLSTTDHRVLDYAAEHHASPNRVKWTAFREASTEIGQLGESLGLAGKSSP